MRRWNGWGDETVNYPVPPGALSWLEDQIGPASPPQDATLAQVIRSVPEPRIPHHALIKADPEDRVRHARGQSLPDWIAMRSGRIGAFPDSVAYPQDMADVEKLYAFARRTGAVLIPYGGGTSVVGHINPEPDGPPTITIDLSAMSALEALDEKSLLATFGAGVRGPYLEAALRARGYTLGHFPQSFEYSTLGGWIATRSSGQQSLYYGRIEDLFAGGRVVTPAGVLDMNPHPASAAGPDLRQFVLGSEGRAGIITRATVRVSPLPEEEQFHGVFFKTWEQGVEAAREIVQARLPLSMLRLSNGAETEATLVLAGHEQLVGFAQRGLRLLGYRQREKTLLIFGATGDSTMVRVARGEALNIARRHGGLHVGQYMGQAWRRGRFLTPYLRNSLWEKGYAIDTLETAVPWSGVLPTSEAIIEAIQRAGALIGERVYAFAHLSHLYQTGASVYITYIFRIQPDPDQTLDLWAHMKRAASESLIAHGGTISHQHGVGTDHAPYLEAEKGTLGLELIRTLARTCDPDGILNPGKLWGEARTDVRLRA